MTEFLRSPLQLLHFLRMRSLFASQLIANNEHALLGFHLTQNLFVEDDHTSVMVTDSCAHDLEAAFAVRRDGLEGLSTPHGLLTISRGEHVDNILEKIETTSNSAALEIGLIFMGLSGETSRKINDLISEMQRLVLQGEKRFRDVSVPLPEQSSGLTIHVTCLPLDEADEALRANCEFRKNKSQADSWYGISLKVVDMEIIVAARLEHPIIVSNPLQTAQSGKYQFTPNYFSLNSSAKKIGRNEKCPCGSGKKFKKCCLNRKEVY